MASSGSGMFIRVEVDDSVASDRDAAQKLDLEGMVTARRPLEEINEAFDDMKAGHGIRTVLDLS